jgi:hypothetical protein
LSEEVRSIAVTAAFDRAVHLRALRRRDVESHILCLTGEFELGHELRAAVGLDGLHGDSHCRDGFERDVGSALG